MENWKNLIFVAHIKKDIVYGARTPFPAIPSTNSNNSGEKKKSKIKFMRRFFSSLYRLLLLRRSCFVL